MIVLSPSIDLVQALARAKLPRGVRWQAASIMYRDNEAVGILTRDVKHAARPVAEVRVSRIDDVEQAVAKGVQRLG